eukprot:13723732-Heterocapsa_arctica.AAC.1
MGHEVCTPVLRLRQYHGTQHIVGFKDWWYCQACEAVGPDMNKTICFAYNHKRGNAQAPDTDNKRSKTIEEVK